jgi:hypothetical protein
MVVGFIWSTFDFTLEDPSTESNLRDPETLAYCAGREIVVGRRLTHQQAYKGNELRRGVLALRRLRCHGLLFFAPDFARALLC